MSNRPRTRRSSLVALTISAIVFLAGCVSTAQREDMLAADQARLVAEDFVSALTQLRGFSPRNTTVQLRPVATDFGEQLASELRRAGFGMQTVPEDDTGPLLVTYDAQGYESDAGRSVGYRVRVGSVELGREYELKSGRVFPMTALSVRGTRISESPLDDSIFDRNVASEDARRIEDAEIGNALEADPSDPRGRTAPATQGKPSILLPPLDDDLLASTARDQDPQDPDPQEAAAPGTPDGAAAGGWSAVPTPSAEAPSSASSIASFPVFAASTASTPGTASAAQRFRPQAPIDVLDVAGDTFAPLADGYAITDQVVLGFGDDSTRLRKTNRARLVAMAKGFDPERETISVLGCSHGPTGAPSRNKALAIGRADRVRVELIAQGVPADQVLDEGCWSAEPVEGMPGRAAIVSVHRRSPT